MRSRVISANREAMSTATPSDRMISEPLAVFVSYSRKDVRHLERLRVHLAPVERDYDIEVWDDGRIDTGQDWRAEIEAAITRAS